MCPTSAGVHRRLSPAAEAKGIPHSLPLDLLPLLPVRFDRIFRARTAFLSIAGVHSTLPNTEGVEDGLSGNIIH